MIRLDNYGYCLEEYIYDLQDNEVKEIGYTLHNEKGQDCAVVGVYKLNGKPNRSIVLWPQTNPKTKDDSIINEEIPEMRLYLDCINEKFNFDDISIYSYDSAKDKDENGFSTTFFTGIGQLNQDITTYTGKDNILVYNKASNMIRTYGSTETGEIDYNSHIESIRLTEFGAITETIGENKIYTMSNKYIKEYEFIKNNSPIESLQLSTTSINVDQLYTYRVTYDEDNMVQQVRLIGDLFSRSETEEFILEGKGKIGQVTDSIYPTLITDNYQNYKYKFLKLWSHDKMKKNEKGEIIFFHRKIYVLRDYDNLLLELRKNTDKLYINK